MSEVGWAMTVGGGSSEGPMPVSQAPTTLPRIPPSIFVTIAEGRPWGSYLGRDMAERAMRSLGREMVVEYVPKR